MPALVLFGRRWQVGSDDFVFNSSIDLKFRLGWFVAAIAIFWTNEQRLGVDCEGGYFIKFYFYGFLSIIQAIIILDCFLIQNSRSGSIMDTKARKYVPFFLYLRILAELCSIGWTVLGILWLYTDKFTCGLATVPHQFVHSLVIFNSVFFIFELGYFFYTFDPLGASKSQFLPLEVDKTFSVFDVDLPIRGTKYTRRWEKRVKRQYRYCFQCSSSDETRDAFREVGKLFGAAFTDDLVDTDIAAGLFLLNLEQKIDRLSLKSVGVVNRNFTNSVEIISDEPSKDRLPAPTLTSTPTQSGIVAINFETAGANDWLTPKYFRHFVKFGCAAFGWILVRPNRPLWRSCVCCSCLPFRNYQYPQKVEGDNCCLCRASGIRDITGVDYKDIAHVTFKNKMFQNPFFVAVDHKTTSIVVSIRGTLSPNDVFLDLTGWPGEIPGYPSTFKAHHGMLRAAMNIKKRLDELEMLSKLMAAHPGYNLVITGISLGAGLSAILALLLKSEYPHVKCYSVSPPGGLLTREAAEFCNDFVVSLVYGDDLVPRMGIFQLERAKFRIIDVLTNCQVPKYQILLQGMFCCQEIDESSSNEKMSSTFATTAVGSSKTTAIDLDADEGIGINGQSAHASPTECTSAKVDTSEQTYTQAHPKTCFPSLEPMYPPGKIFHITKIPKCERAVAKSKWHWRWADRTEFDEIIVSPSMLWDHLPFDMTKALKYWNKTGKEFGSFKTV